MGEIWIDQLSFLEALEEISDLVERGQGGFVVTPNVDHVVLAEEDERFRQAYSEAALSLADGIPVVWASHVLGQVLPEKISGSDIGPQLLRRAGERGWRVFFVGAGPGVAEKAAQVARARWNVNVVGTIAPMLSDDVEIEPALVAQLRSARPDLLLVAFGAPKQEIFCHRIAKELRPAVLLGVGATLDFIAGTQKRAPPWMSRNGLEWLYRLSREPSRLWKRYLVRDPRFLLSVAHTLRLPRSERVLTRPPVSAPASGIRHG
ncbi:MAG: WecB/TagA/CpsF family glycosyltransferase [Myxococcaceae bacterium]